MLKSGVNHREFLKIATGAGAALAMPTPGHTFVSCKMVYDTLRQRFIGCFLSDPRIPRVATIRVSTAQTLAEPFEVVRQSQAIDVLHVLITELPRDSQADGASERHGKFVSVHAVSEKRLRVQRVRHVDAL